MTISFILNKSKYHLCRSWSLKCDPYLVSGTAPAPTHGHVLVLLSGLGEAAQLWAGGDEARHLTQIHSFLLFSLHVTTL